MSPALKALLCHRTEYAPRLRMTNGKSFLGSQVRTHWPSRKSSQLRTQCAN